ncbi:MAG: E3 binding domain-containing protein, partial [Anaerolineae bacterium]|nr:E3 binding domain-containing protein [Anaerolineae bacterium]
MATEFFIPKLGQTVEQVVLVKWLVPDGSKVSQGQEILEVETDKAVFPVEANGKGYIHIGPFQEGDEVPVLTVVALIGKEDELFSAAAHPVNSGEDTGETSTEVTRPVSVSAQSPIVATTAQTAQVFVSPRARKLAREKNIDVNFVQPSGGGGIRVIERDIVAYLNSQPKASPVALRMAASEGIDLRSVSGTGPGGKIMKDDVTRSVSTPPPTLSPLTAMPQTSPAGDVLERIPLKGVRGIIADRMGASVHTTARVTLMMEVDATELVAVRERLKNKVATEWGFAPGYNDLLAEIVARALRKFPYMNARLASDAIEVR